MKQYISLLGLVALIASCTHKPAADSKPTISVTLPVEKYFVDRLADSTVAVNVIIPQNVGHSEYSPRPSQMMSLSNSIVYFAIGQLDFENAWKGRMISVSNVRWVDMNKGISLVTSTDDAHHKAEAHSHHDTDPHYWLSPKQTRIMVQNMANELRTLSSFNVDSALAILLSDIDAFDQQLSAIGAGKTFVIYHPALTYLARDYDMTQLEIEKDGNAPSPQSYQKLIETARANGAEIVFVQQGYDEQKAQAAADMIGAKVVSIAPENYDWLLTMQTIVSTLSAQ